MIFVSYNQPMRMLHGEEPFGCPASFVTLQRPAILGSWLSSISFMLDGHLRNSRLGELFIQCVRIVGVIAEDLPWQGLRYTGIQCLLHQRHWMWASAACVHGERNAFSVAKDHDVGALAASGLPNAVPVFAGATVPWMKRALRSRPRRSRRRPTRAVSTFSNVPSRDYCWKR